MDSALNNLQRLICHKTNQTKPDDWVGMVTHWELYKKLKFDPANKWCVHNPESILENETHKIFWDFYIQMDHLISARRLDQVIANSINKKENFPNCGLCCLIIIIIMSCRQHGYL